MAQVCADAWTGPLRKWPEGPASAEPRNHDSISATTAAVSSSGGGRHGPRVTVTVAGRRGTNHQARAFVSRAESHVMRTSWIGARAIRAMTTNPGLSGLRAPARVR